MPTWTPTDATTEDGARILISDQGAIAVEGATLALDASAPDWPSLDVCWRLLVSGAAAALSPALKAALGQQLGATLASVNVPDTGAGKLARGGLHATLAALLGHTGVAPDQAAALRRRVGQGEGAFAQPLLQVLLIDALGGGLSAPEDAAGLRAAFGALTGPRPTFEVERRRYQLAPADAAIYAAALCFARSAEAFGVVRDGHAAFASVHGDGWRVEVEPLDAVERGALREALRVYIDESTTTVFQYGLWKGVAGKACSDLTNAEAIAPLIGETGSLRQDPPSLDGRALTAAQAAWFLNNLDLIRNQRAVNYFLRGVAAAADLFRGAPLVDPSTLPGTSFALVKRVQAAARNRAEGSEDGRLDYASFADDLREAAGGLGEALRAALKGLAEQPPQLAGVRLPTSGVDRLVGLLAHRCNSDRAVGNLGEALAVWASDGALDEAAFAAFAAFLDGYLALWPALETFDFNKLGRLARAAQSGDPVPLCQVNGQPVDPGRFHVAVGEAVMAALAGIAFPQAWIPRRFGYRARQCIELVDLLAEQASRGKGPLPELHARGGRVAVVATTSDLAYNLLVFGQVWSSGQERWLYLQSDGALVERRRPEDKHRLFTAWVDASGHLDVQVPAKLSVSPRAYPIQNPYGVGDYVDVEFYAQSAQEEQVEASRFETRYQVRLGIIRSYDAMGNYTVELPDSGSGQQSSYTYEQIRSWNNPHYVPEQGGSECSMRFDVDRDTRFREDLLKMEDIAKTVGLLDYPLGLSEVALARLQKQFLKELNAYTSHTLTYPREPPVDEADREFHSRLANGTFAAGEFLRVGRGVCRHQFIREHMGKQRGGIDERFASGAANTYSGDFRGLHIWGEVNLADQARLAQDNPEPSDSRYLSDATWSDPYVPLWEGAYGTDKRRIEMYNRTESRSHLVVKS